MARKNKEKKKSKKGIIIAVIILLIVVVAVGGGKKNDTEKKVMVTEVTEVTETEKPTIEATTVPKAVKFFVVNQSEYIRDGKKCILYRVYADKEGLSEEELLDSYNSLIKQLNDDYYLHDVMVYSSEEFAAGGNAYDVAEVEEMEKGKTPEVRFR